jgi:hypothetical protein
MAWADKGLGPKALSRKQAEARFESNGRQADSAARRARRSARIQNTLIPIDFPAAVLLRFFLPAGRSSRTISLAVAGKTLYEGRSRFHKNWG